MALLFNRDDKTWFNEDHIKHYNICETLMQWKENTIDTKLIIPK